MTKKLILLSFIALALIVGGCSKQNPFEAQSDSTINDGEQISLAKKVSVPLKGYFETVIETFYPIEFVNGVPVKFEMHIVGTGIVSHLGNCTVAFDQIADYSVNPMHLRSLRQMWLSPQLMAMNYTLNLTVQRMIMEPGILLLQVLSHLRVVLADSVTPAAARHSRVAQILQR